ncbi:MAG: helix-turn-helix transcriptional regulator [Candidatus Thermoplasmatota archaeon]|nr:helix-turn-helix transcriptional regulator [Candidatus Thermoplasmatota archaeon]
MALSDRERWEILLKTSSIVGGRNRVAIISRLFFKEEILSFNQLKKDLNVSSMSLSRDLKLLEAMKILKRDVSQEGPVRVTYTLTEDGRDLYSAFSQLELWGQKHLNNKN